MDPDSELEMHLVEAVWCGFIPSSGHSIYSTGSAWQASFIREPVEGKIFVLAKFEDNCGRCISVSF